MWPPTLEQFKGEVFTDVHQQTASANDVSLQLCLDAAIADVEEAVWYMDFTSDVLDPRPKPNARTVLGTLRQAAKWYARRDSPEGIKQLGELGGIRIPSFDPDVERLLGIGRFGPPVIA